METMDRCSQSYTQLIKENPLLSRQEEIDLYNIMHKYKGGKLKKDAREKLFNSNLRLVLQQANVHRYNISDFHDLVSAGSMGLTIAIDRFNPRRFKTKLSTYAIPWIRLKVTQYINSNATPVHIPSNLIDKSRKYKKINNILKKDDTELTDNELMEKLDLSERGLRNIKLSQVKSVSLDAEIMPSKSHDGDPEKTLKDVLSDSSPTSDKLYLAKDNKRFIMAALKELSPIEQEVLSSRYLNGEKENLDIIGKQHGLTGERVRQIEFKAFRKMRRTLKKKYNFTN